MVMYEKNFGGSLLIDLMFEITDLLPKFLLTAKYLLSNLGIRVLCEIGHVFVRNVVQPRRFTIGFSIKYNTVPRILVLDAVSTVSTL